MKNGGGHFAPILGGHFELESGGHFKLELGGQYDWNLHRTKDCVLSVTSTLSFLNALNSFIVWKSKSFLSTTKTTLYTSGSSITIWLALNEVKVLPEPVVCQM